MGLRAAPERINKMTIQANKPATPLQEINKEASCTITKPGRFSFFRAPAKTVMPYKAADIKGVYQYITLYSPAQSATNALRAIDDPKQAREFKASHFDFVCFSGTFIYRKDDGLIQHSGLLCLDFDHVGNRFVLWELRQRLIADPFFTTWLLFTSPSGDGLKWVISIDLNLCDHRTWFRALQNYVRNTYHLEADEKCGDVSRTCFLPFDGNCYVHPSILNEPDVCPF